MEPKIQKNPNATKSLSGNALTPKQFEVVDVQRRDTGKRSVALCFRPAEGEKSATDTWFLIDPKSVGSLIISLSKCLRHIAEKEQEEHIPRA